MRKLAKSLYRRSYAYYPNNNLVLTDKSPTMHINFLGTASMIPNKHRNVSSIAVNLIQRGEAWIFDCGEGTARQLISHPDRGFLLSRITKIFITHMHGDHFQGLVGLIYAIIGSDVRERNPERDSPPIDIFGPKGIRDYLFASFYMNKRYKAQEFPWFHVYEYEDFKGAYLKTGGITPDVNRVYNIYKDSFVTVRAKPILHSITCYGYVIDIAPKMKLNVEKVNQIAPHMPKRYLADLKLGMNVVLNDGLEVQSSDVLDLVEVGKKVIILGDTSNPTNLLDIGEGADLLVHESTFRGGEESRARELCHSTPIMAGRMAKKFNVKHLVLTHFGQQFGETDIDQFFVPDAKGAMESENVYGAVDFLKVTL
jgi:ribonuclease Z